MASAVANRYARALVDLILAPGASIPAEEALAQLRAIEGAIADSAELRTALLTPGVKNERKRAVIARIAGQLGVSPLIINFVFVVIDHRRIGMIAEIREAVELLVEERLGFVRAEVSSAAPLDDRYHALLESELSRLTGKRMRLRFAVNPELLGGAVARIGSTVYDGSVRGQLQQLRRRMAEPSAE
jgi:F-type H+-transporting ATPase subunit delta